MRKVGSREFKNRLGRYLGEVRRGHSLVITDRGTPIARVSPVDGVGDSTSEPIAFLRKLESEGKLRLATRGFGRFRPAPGRGKSASAMLIEDRR